MMVLMQKHIGQQKSLFPVFALLFYGYVLDLLAHLTMKHTSKKYGRVNDRVRMKVLVKLGVRILFIYAFLW